MSQVLMNFGWYVDKSHYKGNHTFGCINKKSYISGKEHVPTLFSNGKPLTGKTLVKETWNNLPRSLVKFHLFPQTEKWTNQHEKVSYPEKFIFNPTQTFFSPEVPGCGDSAVLPSLGDRLLFSCGAGTVRPQENQPRRRSFFGMCCFVSKSTTPCRTDITISRV